MKNLLENIIKTVLLEQRVVGKVSSLPMKEFDAAIAEGAVFAFEVSSKGVTKPAEVVNNVVGAITSNSTVGANSKYGRGNYFYLISDPVQNDKRQKIVVWIYPNGDKFGTFDTLRQYYAKMGAPGSEPTATSTQTTDQPDIKKTQTSKEVSVKFNPAYMSVKYIGQSPIMNRAVYERILKDLKKEDSTVTGVNTVALQSKENIIFNKDSEETVSQPSVTPDANTTAVTPTVTTPTDDQIKLAKEYRIWANSTPALKKKYGKTSPYDLDAVSSKPWNTYFEKSYAVGKTEFEQRTPGVVTTPEDQPASKQLVFNNKKGTVIQTYYYNAKTKKYTPAAKWSVEGNEKIKYLSKSADGKMWYIDLAGTKTWIGVQHLTYK